MLFEQLGIENRDEFFLMHEFTWRHTARACEIIFNNIRGLPDSSLEAGGGDWKLVVDFPFDEPGRSPHDDLARLQKFRQDHPDGTRTLAWIPSFLRPEAQSDLGLLVILEHILTGERFDGYASILPMQDRPVARTILENRRDQLRQRVLTHLEVAYGIDRQSAGSVDTSHELSEHFESLLPGFDPQPPVAANLADAMQHLLEQALERQFPAHPKFEAPPKGANLRKVYEQVRRATQVEDGRIEVDKPLRPWLRAIANPLLLGEMHETHFVLGQHWKNHFNRKAAEAGGAVTVGQLRKWTDEPQPMGLPKQVQNLVILIYAEQTNRTSYAHGAPTDATLTSMPDHLELRTWVGPPEDQWKVAIERAGSIFGLAPSPLLNATNVSALATDAKKVADESLAPCRSLCKSLRDRCGKLGISATEAPRMETATAVLNLVDRISSAHPNDVVGVLASATVATSETAMGRSLKSATELVDRIDATNWGVFDDIAKLSGKHQATASAIRDKVRQAVQADEHAIPLAPTLKDAQASAVRLLAEVATAKTPPPPPPPPTDRQIVSEGDQRDLPVGDARDLLTDLQQKMEAEPSRRLTIKWRIDEERTTK